MHGSTSAGGNVAKCASGKLCVGMVQTLRRLARYMRRTAEISVVVSLTAAVPDYAHDAHGENRCMLLPEILVALPSSRSYFLQLKHQTRTASAS